MNPTLTKASEALRESLADWQGNGDLPTFAVIAVLKAIREPDDRMIGAYVSSVAGSARGRDTAAKNKKSMHHGKAVVRWQAMIDAITNSNPTANHGSGE